MEQTGLIKEIEISEGAQITVNGKNVIIKGKKGEVTRKLFDPKITIKQEGNKIILSSKKETKKEKKILHTFAAHIKNMIHGSEEGHTYKLKICSGHFPMNVTLKGDELSIKNYLGEKIPRVVKIKKGADVKLNGTEILIESTNLEIAGHIASDIEQIMRVTNRDRRIFQDGIYIVEKNGKQI